EAVELGAGRGLGGADEVAGVVAMHEDARAGALHEHERRVVRSDEARDEGAAAGVEVVDRRCCAAAEGVGVRRIVGPGEAEAGRQQDRAKHAPGDRDCWRTNSSATTEAQPAPSAAAGVGVAGTAVPVCRGVLDEQAATMIKTASSATYFIPPIVCVRC